jgi:hypothetical protein
MIALFYEPETVGIMYIEYRNYKFIFRSSLLSEIFIFLKIILITQL